MPGRLRPLALGVAAAFVLTACGSDAPRVEPALHPLVGSSWRLEHVKDTNGNVDIPASAQASISFDETTVVGRDGCNTLASGYSRDGDRLNLRAPNTSTSKICTLTDRPHNAALASVDAVLRANGSDPQTHQPVRATISGDQLTIAYGDIVTLRLTYAGAAAAVPPSPSSTPSR